MFITLKTTKGEKLCLKAGHVSWWRDTETGETEIATFRDTRFIVDETPQEVDDKVREALGLSKAPVELDEKKKKLIRSFLGGCWPKDQECWSFKRAAAAITGHSTRRELDGGVTAEEVRAALDEAYDAPEGFRIVRHDKRRMRRAKLTPN
mgnify:CR=1 FL=1